MSHSPLCLYKRQVLSQKLRRSISLEIVHEICDILIERGLASNADEVKAFIENADVNTLEELYHLAEERRKKKRRLLEDRVRYEYAYIG
jgi:hypothetical protein